MSSRAEKLYVYFHKYNPKKVGKFPSSFSIPNRAILVGDALYVLYRSSKLDPITYAKPTAPINYIHEHEKGVRVYRLDDVDGSDRKVPKRIHTVDTLVFLGKCLGFAYLNHDGEEIEAECTNCELYSIPTGKALLVIEKKREVLAMIWGGKLGVEPRGIVG